MTEQSRLEQQLRQSQKLDAIGQLTGGVAHDFNNILTVIIGTVEILVDGVADRPHLVAVTEMIDVAATRGADLTRQLLAFARRQSLEPRRTDVNTLVSQVESLLRPTLGEAVDIVSKLDRRAWCAMNRSVAAFDRTAQFGGQRAGCHAEWRQADVRNRKT